jgi:flagellar hook-associated protein 1 FlgK
MTAINTVLQTALRSMDVATQSLAVAANNIANEKTPGYARQRLIVESSPSADLPIRIGTGVRAVMVQGMRDELIERRMREEVSAKSGEEARNTLLRDVETLFNDAADTGMLPVITDFFNAFHGLALDPSSTNSREQVRMASENLSNSFSTRSEELKRFQNIADKSIGEDVDHINNLTSQIAALSGRIRGEEAAGELSNDLRDQRGQLVRELSESLEVRDVSTEGNFQLTIGGTMVVYDGSTSKVIGDTSSATGFVTLKVAGVDVSSQVTHGKIEAWTDARDRLIPGYLAKLDQMAYEIGQQVNAIHSTGYTRSGTTEIDFFEPLASATDASRQLRLSAAVAGDLGNIAASSLAAGTDNETAIAIGNLIHQQSFSGGSVVDQYRSLVFQVGSDTTNSDTKLDQHSALLHQLENRRDSVSGVSVDEETMQILRFQRSYQASASVIRIVDDLIQTLLGLVR